MGDAELIVPRETLNPNEPCLLHIAVRRQRNLCISSDARARRLLQESQLDYGEIARLTDLKQDRVFAFAKEMGLISQQRTVYEVADMLVGEERPMVVRTTYSTARSNIYRKAERLGFTVKCREALDGDVPMLMVTRIA